MKSRIPALFIGYICFSFLAFAEQHRPFDEMKGDCSNYQFPMQNELKAWKEPAVQTSELKISQKTALKLAPAETVKLLLPPEKKFDHQKKSYAGMAPFQVDSDGLYRISLNGKIWADVVDKTSTQFVKAEKFEMQTGCADIFKVVVFRLKEGVPYAFQISSSASESPHVLLTKE